MYSIAIVGSGISGLGAAHFLHRDHGVTLFEQDARVGGHAHTTFASEPGTERALPIDTGFMVFNYQTYPNLCRLFEQFEVPVKKTSMSFAVSHRESGLEFCGSSLNHLFAQRRNLFSPRFIRMLLAVNRFNSDAAQALADPSWGDLPLREYAQRRGYGRDFLEFYLTPMAAAVWSSTPDRILEFPARTLLRFFHNHGFLGLHTQHQWWTVDGGSHEYVNRITVPWRHCIRRGCGVRSVRRRSDGVELTLADGSRQKFDRVILATHARDSLALLADPTPGEREVLGAFTYSDNIATLHTDTSVMPRTRLAWSSWNYVIRRAADGIPSTSTVYWMNNLQGVSERENYFVSINGTEAIDPAKVIRTFRYAHPHFSLAAINAQARLPDLNAKAMTTTRTFLAGAWARYGFHEDGLWSAINVAQLLLGRDPWQAANATRRIEVKAPPPRSAPEVIPAG